MNQIGRNGGVTGLVDITGTPKFTARIYRWRQALDALERDRSGRGDDAWGSQLTYKTGGNLALAGKVRLDGYPLPDKFKGQAGTIQLQLHTGVTDTLSVIVTAASLSLDEKTEGFWDIALTCRITADPALAGFAGTQPTADAPGAGDKQTWEGLTKTIDPQSLADGATQRYDIEGLADTDEAEVAKIGALIAAATSPVNGLKLRPAGFQRLGATSGVITLQWGRTSTADDVTMPQTRTIIDPQGLASEATSAAINATPPTPTGDSFVKRTSATSKLHDTATLTIDTYGLRSTKDDVEMDGTQIDADPKGLGSTATITKETTSETPPAPPTLAGYVYRTASKRQLNPGHWAHTFHYGLRTTQEDVEMEGTTQEDDPQDIADSGTIRLVTDSATPPDAPAAMLGTKLVSSTRLQLNQGKWAHTFIYRRRDSKDDIEMPGTETTVDPADLESRGRQTLVYDTGETAPAATVPTGLQVVGTTTQQVHDGKAKVVYALAKDTSQQKEEQAATRTVTDPGGLASRATVAKMDATPTLPDGMVERETIHKPITHDHNLNVVEGGLRSTTDDIEMPGTENRIDPLGIESTGRKTKVYDTATGAGTDPTPPGGMQIVAAESQEVNRTKSKTTWLFDVLNSEQKIEFRHQRETIDPNDLTSEKFDADVFTVGSPPSTPAAPDGEKIVDYVDIPVTPTKSVRVWRYAKNDSKDALEQRHTFTETDPQGLASRAAAAKLDATPSLPAGFVERASRSVPVTPDHDLNIVEGGLRSTKDDREMPGTFTVLDPEGLESTGRKTTVYSGSEPADPTPPAGLQIVDSRVEQINSTHSEKVWRYDVLTSKQRREFAHQRIVTDPADLDSEEIEAAVFTTASPPADPAAPSGLKLDRKWDVPLTPAKSLRVYEYRKTTSQDRIELPGTFTVTDPKGLRSHGRQTSVYDTDTPPTDPTPPDGQKITGATVKALDGAKSVKVWEFGTATSQDELEWGNSLVRTDPVALGDERTIAQVQDSATPTAPTLPTGMKLVDTISKQQTDGKWLHRFNYGLMDRQDAAVIEQARAEYSSVNRGGYATAQVVDWSADPKTLAETWHNALRGNVDYEAVDVRRLNLNKALVIQRYRQPSILVTAQMGTAYHRHVRCKLDGATKKVFVVQAVTRGTAGKWVQLSAQPVLAKTLRFSITVRVSATTLPLHNDLIDTVSSGTFLGLPAKKVTYLGAEVRGNLADTAPQVWEIQYWFLYSSIGFIDDQTIPTGGLALAASATITSSDKGWVDIAKTGLSVTDLTTGDYSVFLS